MKERPILFSGPMVRAILDGTKTQTRRLVKPQSAILTDEMARAFDVRPPNRDNHAVVPCPYGVPGDRLYVREAFHWGGRRISDDGTPWVFLAYAETPKTRVLHPTREQFDRITFADESPEKPWTEMRMRPGIHLPKWASRITLEITTIRVERLQDISESDALAEGIERRLDGKDTECSGTGTWHWTAKRAYCDLWEHINGSDSWALNPWVWVVEFRRVEQ